MVIFKLSSQFTDFVYSRSSNPEKILSQVSNAIAEKADLGNISEYDAAFRDAFHSEKNMTDAEMANILSVEPEEKGKLINSMYGILKDLIGTGKIDLVTRKLIDKFFAEYWKPIETPAPTALPEQIRPGVIKRKRETGAVVNPEISTTEIVPGENTPRWERNLDRIIDNMDRKRKVAVETLQLLSIAGIIDVIPEPKFTSNIQELKTRLAERKFLWTKFTHLNES